MLRAIMNFLKLRFPAFLGMNVLYSLALFGTLASILTSPLDSFPQYFFSSTTNPSFVKYLQSYYSYSGTAINAVAKSASKKSAS